jgi:hypothetical protein
VTSGERLFFVQLYRWFPSILQVLEIIRPETLVRWHRAGFRSYWRWKSRGRGGRPQIDAALRALIREMSVDNPLWGAPRIHGELLKLGFEIAQSTVAKCMIRRRGPRGQSWWTFLRNHTPDIAAMDLFVVPTFAFGLLYGFVIVRLGRRELIWIGVTSSPTAEWIARQITEAFPWGSAPHYLIRDRDRAFGAVVRHRLRAMGIRDKPIAPRSPWQNGVLEIGSIPRECLDSNAPYWSGNLPGPETEPLDGEGGMKSMQALLIIAATSSFAVAQTPSPEVDACRASGLIALKQRSSDVKNVEIDLDSATIIKADTKIEDTPVKAVVLGEAYIERKKGDKPQTFVCVLGEKGKVLLTLFSNQ